MLTLIFKYKSIGRETANLLTSVFVFAELLDLLPDEFCASR